MLRKPHRSVTVSLIALFLISFGAAITPAVSHAHEHAASKNRSHHTSPTASKKHAKHHRAHGDLSGHRAHKHKHKHALSIAESRDAVCTRTGHEKVSAQSMLNAYTIEDFFYSHEPMFAAHDVVLPPAKAPPRHPLSDKIVLRI